MAIATEADVCTLANFKVVVFSFFGLLMSSLKGRDLRTVRLRTYFTQVQQHDSSANNESHSTYCGGKNPQSSRPGVEKDNSDI